MRFVDIVKKHIHTVDLKAGPSSVKTTPLPHSIGVTVDVPYTHSNGVFAFGGKYGVGLLDRKTGEYRLLKEYWTEEEKAVGLPDRMRGNDGGVDSKGRFWVGVMNDPAIVPIGTDGGEFVLAFALFFLFLIRLPVFYTGHRA